MKELDWPGVRTLWAYRDAVTHEVEWMTWGTGQGITMSIYESALDLLVPAFTHWQVTVSHTGTPYAQVMLIPEGDRPPPGALTWAEALKQARIYARML